MRASFESVTATLYPQPVRQVQLALVLADVGARFVIVGSTARHLRGSAARLPRDLDLVVARSDLRAFTSRLSVMSDTSRSLRPGSGSPQRAMTSWTPVDVFLEEVLPAWHTVEIGGTSLSVVDE